MVTVNELTEEQGHAAGSFENDYGGCEPMVVYVHGRIRSALIAAAWREDGILWADDGALDRHGASHHVEHFADYPISGGRHGPWKFGNGTVEIRKVRPGDDDYRAWRMFEQLAPGGIRETRANVERQLQKLLDNW